MLLGLGVFVPGLVGAFFSRLIMAAVSWQREYLADAGAVQFTRNPTALAGRSRRSADWPKLAPDCWPPTRPSSSASASADSRKGHAQERGLFRGAFVGSRRSTWIRCRWP
jgi:Zn-dependent protease with chaperone function